MISKRSLQVALLLMLAVSIAAWADIEGVYSYDKTQQLNIAYRDDQHIRIQLTADSYMLVNGKESFMLNRQGDTWMAMNLASLKVVGDLSGALDQARSQSRDYQNQPVEIKATGKTETIAGFSGEVYEVTVGKQRHQVVMTEDNQVKKLQAAMIQLSGRVAQGLGFSVDEFSGILQAARQDGRGVLRVDDSMQLKSIKTVQRDKAYYQLPGNTRVIQLPNINFSLPGQ